MIMSFIIYRSGAYYGSLVVLRLEGFELPAPSFSRYDRGEYTSTASYLLSRMVDVGQSVDQALLKEV